MHAHVRPEVLKQGHHLPILVVFLHRHLLWPRLADHTEYTFHGCFLRIRWCRFVDLRVIIVDRDDHRPIVAGYHHIRRRGFVCVSGLSRFFISSFPHIIKGIVACYPLQTVIVLDFS